MYYAYTYLILKFSICKTLFKLVSISMHVVNCGGSEILLDAVAILIAKSCVIKLELHDYKVSICCYHLYSNAINSSFK